MQSDEELVVGVKNGDKQALDNLIEKYKWMILKITRSYFLVGGDREDLMQEGRIGVMNAAKTFNGASSFKSYAYTCIRSSVFSAIKKAKSKKNLPLENYVPLFGDDEEGKDKTEIVVGTAESPETGYINREAAEELSLKIKNGLSKFENAILEDYLKGYSYKEISERTGKTEKSVDNALCRIRRKIKAVLSEENKEK